MLTAVEVSEFGARLADLARIHEDPFRAIAEYSFIFGHDHGWTPGDEIKVGKAAVGILHLAEQSTCGAAACAAQR